MCCSSQLCCKPQWQASRTDCMLCCGPNHAATPHPHVPAPAQARQYTLLIGFERLIEMRACVSLNVMPQQPQPASGWTGMPACGRAAAAAGSGGEFGPRTDYFAASHPSARYYKPNRFGSKPAVHTSCPPGIRCPGAVLAQACLPQHPTLDKSLESLRC